MASEEMKVILVTGSNGYLGLNLCRALKVLFPDVKIIGLDKNPGPQTTHVGSFTDAALLDQICPSASQPESRLIGIFHTAALHRPHIGMYSDQDFIDVNISGTLTLLQLASSRGCDRFIFTSTTSAFGSAMKPKLVSKDSPALFEEAVWVSEDLPPIPKNIYGLTKLSAEHLCKLHADRHPSKNNVIILRTSRFFPEDDFDGNGGFGYLNSRANELLYRRIDVRDVVAAHIAAFNKAPLLHYDMFIISGRTPFVPEDTHLLATDASSLLFNRFPRYASSYAQLGMKFYAKVDRVYDARKAEKVLGFVPKFDFDYHLERGFVELDRSAEIREYT